MLFHIFVIFYSLVPTSDDFRDCWAGPEMSEFGDSIFVESFLRDLYLHFHFLTWPDNFFENKKRRREKKRESRRVGEDLREES